LHNNVQCTRGITAAKAHKFYLQALKSTEVCKSY